MSQETWPSEQLEASESVGSNVARYSTRLVERTIERALDVIYETSNHTDPKFHHWRHSIDEVNLGNN